MSRTPPQPPPTFTSDPSTIIPAIQKLIATSTLAHKTLINAVNPLTATPGNTLLPLIHAENALLSESTRLIFHDAVSPNKPVRDAAAKARSLLRAHQLELSADDSIFQLLEAVHASSAAELDPESRNFLDKRRKESVKNGLRIPEGPDRERFRQIQERLAHLASEFSQNMAEDTAAVWFTPSELEGFPADDLARLEHGAAGTENEDKVKVEMPRDLGKIMQDVANASSRRRARAAYDSRCPSNVAVFDEAIRLRDEAAHLLGYANHAALSTEDKMARTPERASSFLDSLRHQLAAGGRAEAAAFLALKKQYVESRGEEFDGRLFTWDVPFYSSMLLRTEHAVDHAAVAEYFPLSTSVDGMLRIFERLFGLEFHEVSGNDKDALSPTGRGEDIIWHPDVQLFSAWDSSSSGGAFLGYLYLDLHHREGKHNNPANFSIVPGFTQDGTKHYPSTALVCGFPPPTPTKPTLLRHPDLVLLLHELGHGIHDLVSRMRAARFHGPMGTVVDFGEAPSQVLENWCWRPDTLRELGRHYSYLSEDYRKAFADSAGGKQQPPETIPDDVVDSLLRAKHVGQALGTLHQVFIGVFDMAVHSRVEGVDFTELWNRLRREIVPTDDPFVLGEGDHWGHSYTNIGHLMSEYDAGYYSYLFSKVYAQDIFATVFAADPMSAEAGRRYRYGVLEKGGSQPEMTTLTEFLGREARMEPFYQDLGLSK
ncbi:metallopeptidase [Colletotrichum plurivorum]|uniref:Metallopeptidase n=1 Tax=Colletotrichum plurivorum TaxID=2175906 RepID=A0A8H6N3E1_9PEZI|nr:metallopeptidase [Colletotrichum plurivorum]